MAQAAKEEVFKALAAEKSFLKQKSKVQWLKLGDRNFKLFYTSIEIRRGSNKIRSLEVDGSTVTYESIIKNNVTSYYQSLFNKSCSSPLVWRSEWWLPRLFATAEDVEHVVLAASKDKAPGPDGFDVAFFSILGLLLKQTLFMSFSTSSRVVRF